MVKFRHLNKSQPFVPLFLLLLGRIKKSSARRVKTVKNNKLVAIEFQLEMEFRNVDFLPERGKLRYQNKPYTPAVQQK